MAIPTITEDSIAGAAPKSAHVGDPTLQPFLQPAFDPADYLNATLPSLSLSSVSSRPLKQGNSVPLADLSSQTQQLLSQLNAHTTRLSTILTQLTDDILRSGGRLAYEVEVLRGETTALTETLSGGLKGDVNKFLPGGIPLEALHQPSEEITSPTSDSRHIQDGSTEEKKETPHQDPKDPEYISQLRTLTLIRTRLETIIKIFGEAMHWTLPPSEISLTSSLISVSAPSTDPSNNQNSSDLEKRGKEFAASLRSEIADLITGSDEGKEGFEAAMARIQALQELANVWKGTAEEKARIRFIEGLVKLAEEKQREKENVWEKRQNAGRKGSVAKTHTPSAPQQRAGGFLDNLQRGILG